MPRFTRLDSGHPLRRLAAALLIGMVCSALALAMPRAGLSRFLQRSNDLFYDTFFKLRATEDQRNGPVTIVAIDDYSLNSAAQLRDKGWPWPRDFYAAMIGYAEKCGARAIVIDILFSEPSIYRKTYDDDSTLADAVHDAGIPVILAAEARDGSPGRCVVSTNGLSHLGAVNLPDDLSLDSVLRAYAPSVHGYPSLAPAAARAIAPLCMIPPGNFLLRYYGPYEASDHTRTFTYLSAIDVVNAATGDKTAEKAVGQSQLKDKIVVLGQIAGGLHDVKASPTSSIFPGVEYQATAIVNLLDGQFVLPVPSHISAAWILLIGCLAAISAGFPRRALLKIACVLVVFSLALVLPTVIFLRPSIHWLAPVQSLVAALLATLAALLWSYFLEDRGRRFFLRALSQYVSPAVADELARDPRKLKISADDRQITVLFTDIAGFTTISETLHARRVSELLNFYFEELSSIVMHEQGTLDKYIGDAIMAFWNAPLEQPDHARRACTAALKMHRRELQIAEQLAALGAPGLLTRIGINTGIMAVGNMGCAQKFNYTVLGDPVNLGSRLEGANKMYGSTILLSESVQQQVAAHFLLRKIDLLRVKGKNQPIAVYELLDEKPGSEPLLFLASTYEEAYSHYQKQQWQLAEQNLVEIFARFPDDGPARTLGDRIAEFKHTPPPADWDGVYVATHK